MITLTSSAADKMNQHMKLRENTLGIRLGLKTSGCNGYSYVLEFVDQTNEEDSVFQNNGISFFIDPKSLIALNGIELDYKRQGLNEGFEFNNPNVTAECGCGESFTI
jgi:iron-sulfur cluster assembly protein|tara:strand:+ start:11000 stop:11320 length:321 start_codon:yes stop_codon:yes gene_type:complete